MEGRGSQEQCERADIAKLTQMKSKVNRLKRSPKATTLNPGQTRNAGTKPPEKQTLYSFTIVAFSVSVLLFIPAGKYLVIYVTRVGE